ncbi:MAG: GxxExxY protein [Bacteroidaceae bacterium]|nr:GxxExxY protein [Prevotellaceae bacterium]MDY5761454.1 GxxExxY protein [Bacteroidaceae bacterium]
MKIMIRYEEYMEMYDIVGAAMEVYNVLGRGMEEAIYQEALELELKSRGKEPHREVWLDTYYKGTKLKKQYKADFMVDDVIVELKSVSAFDTAHRAQLFNYMRITKQKRGILMNFGGKGFAAERYLYHEDTDDFVLLKESNYRNYIK